MSGNFRDVAFMCLKNNLSSQLKTIFRAKMKVILGLLTLVYGNPMERKICEVTHTVVTAILHHLLLHRHRLIASVF